MRQLPVRARHNFYKILIRLVNIPRPEKVSGAGSSAAAYKLLAENRIDKVLVVTDKGILKSRLADRMLAGFKTNSIDYHIYSGVKPDPSVTEIEEGFEIYEKKECRGVVAIGGGSPLDCAKVIAARAASEKTVQAMKGSFKIRGKPPFLMAVPTTAGTGTEATIFAVITEQEQRVKFTIIDPKLVPDACILDPELVLKLPPELTAYTGMDALTHAVEAYLSIIGTSYSDQKALAALKLIFDNLEKSYRSGSDLPARKAMLDAAHYGGLAFSRAMIGYAHAIAHNLGAVYGIQHGLANAIALPPVLEYSKQACAAKMADLAVHGGLGTRAEKNSVLAEKLIAKIRQLNRALSIPPKLRALEKEDVPSLAEKVDQEANPAYPVPRLLWKKDLEKLLYELVE